MTSKTAMIPTTYWAWVAADYYAERERLSQVAVFDEDYYHDALLGVWAAANRPCPPAQWRRLVAAAYRQGLRRRSSEGYGTVHPDERFFSMLADASGLEDISAQSDGDDEREAEAADRAARSVWLYICAAFTAEEAQMFKQRTMLGLSLRDLADIHGTSVDAVRRAVRCIAERTRRQFKTINQPIQQAI